ncbi:hypothetical protein [Streptomyces sp. bgisy022]|uniref:hypothetical protein n=1 Tax=Streptomyces sp. bgisy022 TaxID=3413769 RepID=UPI003D745349
MRRRRFVSGLLGAGAAVALAHASAGPSTALPPPRIGPRLPGPRDWRAVTAPECAPAAQLLAVAAAGPDLAWAVGEEGRAGSTRGTPVALTWDGTAWSRAGLGGPGWNGALRSVAAAGGGSAWAVGADTAGTGRLLRWDGTAWQDTPFPGRGTPGTTLTGVTTGPAGQVWVSGRNAEGQVLLHGTEDDWRWTDRPPVEGAVPVPSGVCRAPGGDVWVYGAELVARWDGDAWTVLPPPGGIRATVSGLLPVADDDLWLTGHAYGVGGPPGKPPSATLMYGDGTAWRSVPAPFSVGMLTGIVGDAEGRPDRIAGWDFWDQTRAHYLRWSDGAWVSERGPVATTPVVPLALAAVPGSGGHGYWSVGTTSGSPHPSAGVRIER